MSRLSPPSQTAPASSYDEAAEAREYEDFFSQQDAVAVAAVDWHTRQEQGLDAAEQVQFEQWLAASPAHAAAFQGLSQDMAAMRSATVNQAASMRENIAPARQAQAFPPVAQTGQQTARPARAAQGAGQGMAGWSVLTSLSSRRNWMALCCAALMAAGVGWYQWDQQHIYTGTFVAERGQAQRFTLPDGSELALDADTQARVVFYRDRREVRLQEGQIMFAVASDSANPFQVLAGPARVTVVGTRFSVRYRRAGMDADTVNVAVEEGHVRVVDAQGGGAGAEVDLVAGQGLAVAANGVIGPVASIAPGSIAPWRKGLVRFDNTPLGDALAELEHYGPTGLVIRDPAVAAMPLGGSFQVGSPEEFARMVAQILPVRLIKNASGKTEIVSVK